MFSCAVCLILLLGACSSTGREAATDSPGAASVPLLDAGLTVGTTLYGSADVDELSGPAEARLEEAVAAGLGGFTYYVDWAELEPEPGRYTLDRFERTLAGLSSRGLAPFVNITVGDIGEYNLPPRLADGEGGRARGVSLGDSAVTGRFGRLLERVAPLVVKHGGFFLGVGNEIDDRLDGEFRGELDGYLRFVAEARRHVRAVEEELAVGVTLTATAVRTRSPTFRRMQEVSDLVAVNYGPISADLRVLPAGEIAADFREVLDSYGRGPVLIQELSCPSASSMGASEAWQADCFERLFAEIAATPEVRFASVFTFQDFDEPTCRAVRDFFLGPEFDELPADFTERFADYLCALGIVRADGTPKPAWQAVLRTAAVPRR